MQQYIFIVGSPRSGTSFTGRLFGCAAKALYWEESNVIWKLFYKNFELEDEVKIFLKFASMAWRIKGHEYPRHEFNHFHTFLNHGLRMDPDLEPYLSLKGEELIRAVIEHYKKKKGFTTLVEKTPTHTLYIQEIKKRFPTASIIHIYRHPLDVMASLKEYNLKYGIADWNPEKAAEAWNDYFAQGCFNSTESVSYHGLVFSKVIGQQLLEKYNLEWNDNTEELYSTVSKVNYRNWHTRLTKKDIWQASQVIDWKLAERVGFYPWE